MAKKPTVDFKDLHSGKSVIEQANEMGLTIGRVLREIGDQLEATETKAKFLATPNKRGGNWRYSKPLKAWGTRQKATEMLGNIHGIFTEKVQYSGSLEIQVTSYKGASGDKSAT